MISVEGIPNDNSGYNYSFGYVDYQFDAIIGQFTNLFQLKFALLPPFWVELFSAWGVCFFALFRIILDSWKVPWLKLTIWLLNYAQIIPIFPLPI